MRLVRNSVLAVALLSLLPLAARAGTYQIDDGTVSAGGLGLGYFGALEAVWLNGFQVQAGMEVIDSVQIMFGAAPLGDGQPANGTPITIVLYTDPNNDGNAIDGVLQRQVAGTIQSADTGTFVNFAIPSITLTPNAWFYVGLAQSFAPNTNGFGANIDSDVSSDPSIGGPSYVYGWFSGTPDITDLSTAAASTHAAKDVDFMIRANGVADTGVPEPATGLLLGAGLAGYALYRRTMRRS